MQCLRFVEAIVHSAGQAALRDALTRAYCDTTFFREEGGGAVGDLTWVVDPVDSTSNVVCGVPHLCLSVARSAKTRAVLA